MIPWLDHVGVVTRDLAVLAEQFERLGFTLTPLARHADGRIGNRCVMLQGSYIELLAVVDPQARSATLDRFLARYAGIHILAFGIDDPNAALARLTRAGFPDLVATPFERAVEAADPAGPRARLTLIQTPDQPEGRVNLVHHLTPEALWQERFLHHANNAATLSEVTVMVADPSATAARLSRLVGCVATPDRAGGLALELAHGRITLAPAVGGVVPRIGGLTLRTSDENAGIGRLAVERSIATHRDGAALTIPAESAGGVDLRFIP